MTDQPKYPSGPAFQPIGSPPVGNLNQWPAEGVVVPAMESTPRGGRSMLTRAGAAVGAVALVAGGGYVALSVGAASGGASSPEAAVSEMFDALSNEDFVGAAAFLEPSERETMVDAGFEMVDELKRLEVFADDLDMSNLDGLDLEFTNLEFSSEPLFEGVTAVEVIGGEASFEVDFAALPYGDVILDMANDELPEGTESSVESMGDTGLKLATVERGGRWYVSYMYSAAELIRGELGMPVPDPALRPAAVGADSPGEAVEAMARKMVDLDPAGVIGMLDPEEMAVLYDYAPLFLDDLQSGADELKSQASDEGVTWALDRLDTSADVDGDTATVFVNGFAGSAEFPGGAAAIDVTRESGDASFEYNSEDGTERILASGSFADGCFQGQASENGESVFDEEICTDELGEEFGSALDEFGNFDTLEGVGVEVHKVDGRWYVSPTRTYTEAMLTLIRAVERDDIDSFFEGFDQALGGFSMLPAEALGAVMGETGEFYEFEDDYFVEEGEEAAAAAEIPTTSLLPTDDFSENFSPAKNGDLLANPSGFEFDISSETEWADEIEWIIGGEPPAVGFVRGVVDYITGASGEAKVLVVEFDSVESAQAEFAQITQLSGGVVAAIPGGELLSAEDYYGDAVKVFSFNNKLGILSTYGLNEADMDLYVADLAAHLGG